ncbi:MAG: [Fe-S]-binding protein [Pirellula sp.]|jgi:hypothetical protein
MAELPKLYTVRQIFPDTPAFDISQKIEKEFQKFDGMIRVGQTVALGVGSRGISNLSEIVRHAIGQIKLRGAIPFIIPAMGSHGGATPEGQIAVLAEYGITSDSMGAEIKASLDVREMGVSEHGTIAYCSLDALEADHILMINRVKPHTDFFGTLGSGLVKMSVIGLGKHRGAKAMHLGAMKHGYEASIRTLARINLCKAPILGGIAILEDARHRTADIQGVLAGEMEAREEALLERAKALMPKLPFEEIDLLVLDRIGKNISGAGMDPNIVNRSIHGYSSWPARGEHTAPFIRRIYVRGLTEETAGNAIGIGLADATSEELIQAMDRRKTEINALTASTVLSCKIPIAFSSDQLAIEGMLSTLPLTNYQEAKIARVADTLSLETMDISESLWESVRTLDNLTVVTGPKPWSFNASGNLFD